MAPNIISLTRIPLGGLVFMFCVQGRWLVAFCCMLVGFGTDGLDGYLAHKLNARSDMGARIDSLSDSALGAGVYFGILIGGAISSGSMIALAIYGLVTWLLANRGEKTNRVRIFFEGYNSFMAIIAGCIAVVVFLDQIGQPIVWAVTGIVAICIASVLIPLKRHRLEFWWGQMIGAENRSQF